MRLSGIVSEAWRNLVSGTARAGWLALCAALVVAGVTVVDVFFVADLQSRAARVHAAAADVRVLTVDGQQVDPKACRNLNRAPNTTAGALRARDPITLSGVDAYPIPAWEATPELGRILGVADPSAAGVWLSTELAGRLGVGPGSTLATREGPMRVGGVFPSPDDGRDTRLAYALVVPITAQRGFDECWARVWPVNPEVDELLRTSTFTRPDDTKTIVLGQLNNNFGSRFSPSTEFDARSTRWIGWCGVAAVFVLGLVAARLRRLEYASALHARQRKVDQLATAGVEALAWSVCAVLLAKAAIVGVALAVAPSEALLVAGLPDPVIAAIPLAATAGMLLGVGLVRERHLFRYFKER